MNALAEMNSGLAPLEELEGVHGANVQAVLAGRTEPAVMRGLVADWPLVRASSQSDEDLSEWLLDAYQGARILACYGPPANEGRLLYSEDLEEINFEQVKTQLDEVLGRILQHAGDASPPTVYMGSTPVDYCLPGLASDHRLDLPGIEASVRIWIGNRTVVAAHFDVLQNIACVCSGRRRFTLFPPHQLANLYVGPLEFTPAGQQVSLVDLNAPDLDKFPRFAEALEHARTAELEPGDAIFIPSMWWHHVEGLESLNILINHWWRETPAYMGAPGDVLLHALLNLKGLPPEQREAWRRIFDHYVFRPSQDSVAHIPPARRGALGELDPDQARQLRALLRDKLNR